MSKIPYHVAVLWPDEKGPHDPALVFVPDQEEAVAALVSALAELELRDREASDRGRRRPLYPPSGRRGSWDPEPVDDWEDVHCGTSRSGDCVEPDVVRMVLESDVAEARAICLRHIIADDSDKTDAWIVAHLTHCVVAGFIPALVGDFHRLAIRQIPKLMARLAEEGA